MVSISPALSASETCQQKAAMYEDEDERASVRFFEPDEGLGGSTNRFDLTLKGTDVKFDGWVLWQGEPQRTYAYVNYQCPEGDVTGAELEACSVWSGPVYAIWSKIQSDVLPLGKDEAAPLILFAGLGASMQASPVWQKLQLKDAPWDGFRLTGCEPSQ